MNLRACFIAVPMALLSVGCSTNLSSGYAYTPPLREEAPRFVAQPAEEAEAVATVTSPVVEAPTVEPESAPIRPSSFALPARLVRGNPAVKKIALTFDDGPHSPFTAELVRILAEFKVPATFFMIGRNVEAHPELVKLSLGSGMELANHTFTHTRLCSLSDEAIKEEILKGADAIEKASGHRPVFFRPPGGEYDERVARIAKELGFTMVLWTADAGDFTTPFGNPSEEAIKAKVLRYVSPGGIVILHDPMPNTLKALPSLITSLRALGYEFVKVSDLAKDPKAVTTGGPRTRSSHGAAVQAISEQQRYPSVNPSEEKNASPEQRITNEAPPQGSAHQGTDQGSQGGQTVEGQGSGGTKVDQNAGRTEGR